MLVVGWDGGDLWLYKWWERVGWKRRGGGEVWWFGVIGLLLLVIGLLSLSPRLRMSPSLWL